jgi:hypothetical protein
VIRITRAYRTELDLNLRQVTACKRHAGAARYAYNWGLARKQEAYKATGKSPSAIDLHRELNALKKIELSWMYQVSKCAPQEALRNLDNAFAHFFRRCKLQRDGQLTGKLGYPQRKTKKTGLGSFRLTGSIVIYHPGARGPLPSGRGMNGPLPPDNHCVILELFVRAMNPCGVACGPAPSGAPCQAMVRGVPLGKPPAGKISAVHSSPKYAGPPTGRQLVPADTRQVARHHVVQPRSPWL